MVPGTEASALIVPGLAAQLAAAHTQRKQAEQEIAALLEALPLFHLLTSLPGRGVRTTAAVIVAIGDGTGFPTAGHLASYAGLAPATKSSDTSIRGEHAPQRGNRLLQRALFQAAFAAIGCKTDPSSRIYYDRQRTRGKTHTQAVLRHGNPAMPAVGLPAPHPIRREHPASRDTPENQSKPLRTTPTGVDETRHRSRNHEGVVSITVRRTLGCGKATGRHRTPDPHALCSYRPIVPCRTVWKHPDNAMGTHVTGRPELQRRTQVAGGTAGGAGAQHVPAGPHS